MSVNMAQLSYEISDMVDQSCDTVTKVVHVLGARLCCEYVPNPYCDLVAYVVISLTLDAHLLQVVAELWWLTASLQCRHSHHSVRSCGIKRHSAAGGV